MPENVTFTFLKAVQKNHKKSTTYRVLKLSAAILDNHTGYTKWPYWSSFMTVNRKQDKLYSDRTWSDLSGWHFSLSALSINTTGLKYVTVLDILRCPHLICPEFIMHSQLLMTSSKSQDHQNWCKHLFLKIIRPWERDTLKVTLRVNLATPNCNVK